MMLQCILILKVKFDVILVCKLWNFLYICPGLKRPNKVRYFSQSTFASCLVTNFWLKMVVPNKRRLIQKCIKHIRLTLIAVALSKFKSPVRGHI